MDKNTIINQVVNESYNNLTSLVEIRTLGLLRGGMHMKKRVYVIKFLNRLWYYNVNNSFNVINNKNRHLPVGKCQTKSNI